MMSRSGASSARDALVQPALLLASCTGVGVRACEEGLLPLSEPGGLDYANHPP